MPADAVPLLIALVILVLMSGFFSATETAFSCSNRVRLRALMMNGNKRAEKTLFLAENKFDNLISTILIGNNIVNLSAATISTLFFSIIIANNPSISSIVSTAVITIAVLIFGEITPKFIAKTFPEKMAMTIYPFIMIFYYLFIPLNFVFSGWKWLIKKLFRLKDDSIVTEDEIMTIVEEAEEDGTLKREETKLIRSVIEFDDVNVNDILVPRVNVTAVDVNSTKEKIKDIFLKEGYSRIPVYRDSLDTIIGTIHEKDFYPAYLKEDFKIEDVIQKAYYTSEHVNISLLLKQLQKKKIHMAIVLDEYGGTAGIVTLEDIIEELVGEIWDEHDEEVSYFRRINKNEFFAECNAPLSDFFEYAALKKEDDEFESSTLSGWVIEVLGEIPLVGRKFDYKNLTVKVTKATVKRVLQISVIINEKEEINE